MPVTATPPAISIQGLTKRYGQLTAVKDLVLEVNRGEIFGFLGLNGAGKTTTIRMLLDLLRPNSGSATVLGHDCQRDGLEVRALVGYLPGEVDFYGDMTGRDVLELLGRLQRRPVSREYRRELQERLDLPDGDLCRKLREYSTGMKRKLCLLQALQGDPPLLILDEPTEGLDPLVQESLYDLLFQLKRKGRTVFMSSHVLSEVERVCERIGLIRKGELALLSSIEDLHKMARRNVRITFSADVAAQPHGLPPEYEILEVKPRAWHLRVRGALGPLISSLADLPVLDVDVAEPRLEEVLIRYYREDNA
jgi:ABC-2 type transport system ATP-binding protein